MSGATVEGSGWARGKAWTVLLQETCLYWRTDCGRNEETGVETTALVQERSKEQLTLGGTGAREDGGNESWQ